MAKKNKKSTKNSKSGPNSPKQANKVDNKSKDEVLVARDEGMAKSVSEPIKETSVPESKTEVKDDKVASNNQAIESDTKETEDQQVSDLKVELEGKPLTNLEIQVEGKQDSDLKVEMDGKIMTNLNIQLNDKEVDDNTKQEACTESSKADENLENQISTIANSFEPEVTENEEKSRGISEVKDGHDEDKINEVDVQVANEEYEKNSLRQSEDHKVDQTQIKLEAKEENAETSRRETDKDSVEPSQFDLEKNEDNSTDLDKNKEADEDQDDASDQPSEATLDDHEDDQDHPIQPPTADNLTSAGKSTLTKLNAKIKHIKTDMNATISSVMAPLKRIEFAPLNVPYPRRRQTFAQLFFASLPIVTQLLFFVLWFNPILWPFLIAYTTFIYFDTAQDNGSRPWLFFKNLTFWQWYADFYPASLIAESELDPQNNYIFGYHPHGIIGMGAFTNFATNATGFSHLFPSIQLNLLTLRSNFNIPIFREVLLWLGVGSVSKKSISSILNKGEGNSCMIVVGGAKESLFARPESADLVLNTRKGFIKLALINGAHLVPVFGFGENQLFNQLANQPGSNIYAFQNYLKSKLGYTLPLFYGRGVFTYNFGLIPRRVPLTCVVGSPIPVTKTANPTELEVDSLLEVYKAELTRLYNKHKHDHFPGENPPDLNFI